MMRWLAQSCEIAFLTRRAPASRCGGGALTVPRCSCTISAEILRLSYQSHTRNILAIWTTGPPW